MNIRNFAIWGLIAVAIIGLYGVMNPMSKVGGQQAAELTYSQLLAKVDVDQITDAQVKGETVQAKDTAGHIFTATTPASQDELLKRFETHHVNIKVQSAQPSIWFMLLQTLLPILVLAGIWIFIMRQMQGGARGAMGFGKSKAKLLTENKNRITFDDVAGVDEAKEELTEIVDFLKDPGKFQRLGGKNSQGRPSGGPSGYG